MFNPLLYHITDQQGCVRVKIWVKKEKDKIWVKFIKWSGTRSYDTDGKLGSATQTVTKLGQTWMWADFELNPGNERFIAWEIRSTSDLLRLRVVNDAPLRLSSVVNHLSRAQRNADVKPSDDAAPLAHQLRSVRLRAQLHWADASRSPGAPPNRDG
jgi:hypothetical protein